MVDCCCRPFPTQCLTGHLDTVNSVVYRTSTSSDMPQIITGGSDSCILVYDRSIKKQEERERLDNEEVEEGVTQSRGVKRARDEEWSDDDDDEDSGGGRQAFVPPIMRQMYN